MASSPTEAAIDTFTTLEERYRLAGGYEIEGHIARLADGLGLAQGLLLEDVSSLSGGERRRVDLMRVLFQEPDMLVLDEPTNHLDLAAKRWLMDELAALRGGLLVVSHDLRLLDEAITKVLYLPDRAAAAVQGHLRQLPRRSVARHQRSGRRRLAMEGAQIQKMRYSGRQVASQLRGAGPQGEGPRSQGGQDAGPSHRSDQAGPKGDLPPARSGAGRGRALDVVQNLAVVVRTPKDVLFDVDVQRRTGRTGWRSSAVTVRASRLCCAAWPKSRSPVLVRSRSAIRWASGTSPRSTSRSTPTKSVLENIDDTLLAQRIADRRKLLGSFGLTGATADQDPGSLSGGERARLSLAMLADGRANLLVLDEPTNNLDPDVGGGRRDDAVARGQEPSWR